MSDRETELEIDAFMAPHIKRARIVLACAGVLDAIGAWLASSTINHAQTMLDRAAAQGVHGGDLDRAQAAVSTAHTLVLTFAIGGIVNIVLAAIGNQRRIGPFYAAVAVFALLSLVQLVLTDGGLLVSWTWWLTAIAVFLGFTAARKAAQLRARVDLG